MLRANLQLVIVVLTLGACSAVRTGGAGAIGAMDTDSADVGMDAELLQIIEERERKCPCDSWKKYFKPWKAKKCCIRTDEGNLNWEGDQKETCAPIDVIKNKSYGLGCTDYCNSFCGNVPHKNDKESITDYLKDKLKDGINMEDSGLAYASWTAQAIKSGERKEFIDISGIHQLHPVGNWRGATGDKTQKRVDAILQSKEAIRANNNTLSEQLINSVESLAPMRSVTGFIAVPFPFCSVKHVLLEGNGRVKALKMAAEQDPELQDFKVEATVLTYSDKKLKMAQEGIAGLWKRYAAEIENMDPKTDAAQIKEYSTFKIPIYKCTIPRFSKESYCGGFDMSGKLRNEVLDGELFAAKEVEKTETGTKYYTCGSDGYVLAPKSDEVTEVQLPFYIRMVH